MAKTPRGLTFAPEASQPFRVCSDLRRKNFDSDAIAEQDVTRAINRSHSTFAQQRFHLVLAVEHGVDERSRVGLQHFAVNRTEAHAVVVFCLAERTVFHSGLVYATKGTKSTNESGFCAFGGYE